MSEYKYKEYTTSSGGVTKYGHLVEILLNEEALIGWEPVKLFWNRDHPEVLDAALYKRKQKPLIEQKPKPRKWWKFWK